MNTGIDNAAAVSVTGVTTHPVPYGACPNCGYCPHCGRFNHYFTYPQLPWPFPPVIWSTSGAGSTIDAVKVTNG